MWLVVCGYVIESVMCVGTKNLMFYDKKFTPEDTFDKKRIEL